MAKLVHSIRMFRLLGVFLCGSIAYAPAAFGQAAERLEASRAPVRHRVTRVEQLLPNARLLVRRPFSWLIGAQYGLGLESGEKLLLIGRAMDPLVAEALAKAAAE